MTIQSQKILDLEKHIRFCYESLAMLVHNRILRQQCEDFAQRSLRHEEDLRKILAEASFQNIRVQEPDQADTLTLADLTIESVLSLGLSLTEYRLDVYKQLRGHMQVKERILFNHFISHAMDEVKFFKREKEMVGVEDILYSLP